MTLMREYYKNQLTRQGQRIYDLLLNNIHKLALDGVVVLYGFYSEQSLSDAADAYIALRDDRPEFYFLDNKVEVILSFPGNLKIQQDKRFTFTQIKRINSLLRKEVENILEKCEDSDVLVKEKKIYWLIATSYRYKDGDLSHDLSGLIVYKEGVCEAIAGLLVIALREAGIPAIKVHGRVRNENHCWAKVWVKGQPYHLDVTWDLASHKAFVLFRYFNVTENVILRDHTIDAHRGARVAHAQYI